MRLSEAMLLGSTVVKPERGNLLYDWHDGKHGCALGMALEALSVAVARKDQKSLALIYERWPWTESRVDQFVCCKTAALFPLNIAQYIAHIFDEHVVANFAIEGQLWSMEQLIDWIRANEPHEEPADAAVARGREAEAVGTVQCGQADPVES